MHMENWAPVQQVTNTNLFSYHNLEWLLLLVVATTLQCLKRMVRCIGLVIITMESSEMVPGPIETHLLNNLHLGSWL